MFDRAFSSGVFKLKSINFKTLLFKIYAKITKHIGWWNFQLFNINE